ncbi:hypothetical protein SPRG_14381 [Saprolegnia parasitica CBS 223.65]|uniref:Uncharacterized protein n=1 Tax=Saprolegnia parasitica (strain CBS 223.65) TaxID=695850 RepID=A0A067BKP3_SAPPC|nr:hypothetical protein SPRG_14381 [Saprolegnia parasitica CBS 223.65]KDO19044.1 hypothetical protein SPRG_14381 [Saprolegnia parasitica CBS 223.65]|eukprot:XP_012210255.1 hypothetical protein SPRG_14381 [Saprolegnia parasitica CBS 223.65]
MMTTRGTKRSRSHEDARSDSKVSPRAKPHTYDMRPAADADATVLNPSLMTERQQLAFLLRKTAPAKSPANSDSHATDDTGFKRKPSPVHKDAETMTARKSRAVKKAPAAVEILCCVCSKYTCTTALFICDHCDKKYPTQKKLGLISV